MRLASVADFAAAVRGRRVDLDLSQGDLAERAGVSRRWVNQFEAGGRATAEVGTILRVLDALSLGLRIDVIPIKVQAECTARAGPRPSTRPTRRCP